MSLPREAATAGLFQGASRHATDSAVALQLDAWLAWSFSGPTLSAFTELRRAARHRAAMHSTDVGDPRRAWQARSAFAGHVYSWRGVEVVLGTRRVGLRATLQWDGDAAAASARDAHCRFAVWALVCRSEEEENPPGAHAAVETAPACLAWAKVLQTRLHEDAESEGASPDVREESLGTQGSQSRAAESV